MINKKELYSKYLNAINERNELQNRIEDLTEQWKNGETALSSQLVQQAIEKGYERLEILKKNEEQLHFAYESTCQKEKNKKYADISIQHFLGVSPTDLKITGGVLSSVASESHLIGETKSAEELSLEKQHLLGKLKKKVLNKEITLEQASKLANDINTSYDFYSTQEKSSGMKR